MGRKPIKLTKGKVLKILNLRKEGLSIGIIADKFSVSRQTISHVILGRYWNKDEEINSKRKEIACKKATKTKINSKSDAQ